MPATRRFPGITFRTETPVQVDLPRMDIAAFVGFAQRGPTNRPVAVESFSEFEDLFGGLYRLAWDEATATGQTACLSPAVKAFFTQGGRLCWIVRVASKQAISNQFLLSGLLQPNGAGGYSSVVATARSVGSWSDSLQSRASVLVDPITAKTTTISPGVTFSLEVESSILRDQPLQAGDVLQLDCSDQIHRTYVVVEAVTPQGNNGALAVTVRPNQNIYWFRKVRPGILTGTVETVAPASPVSLDGCSLTVSDNGAQEPQGQEIKLEIPLANTTQPETCLAKTTQPGDWLRLNTGNERLWLLVKQPLQPNEISISSAWLEGADPKAGVLTISQLQRLQLVLRVREEQDNIQPLSNLGCADPHPRFIGALPEDNSLFDPGFGKPHTKSNPPKAQLWQAVKYPRFPLSFVSDNGKSPPTVCLPLGLDNSTPWRGAIESTLEPLERDGLVPASGQSWSDFMAELFLDPALGTTGQRSLVTEANDRLYLQGQALTGLHALFPVEEVSLLALPDAAHREWEIARHEPVTLPEPSEPKPTPDPCVDPSSLFKPKQADATPKTTVSQAPEPPKVKERAVWRLVPEPQYETSGLLRIQLAAARLAAARGDMVAVLGLPKHYRLPEIGPYQQQLMAGLQLAGDTTASYVALYHPWLISRAETGALIHTHPAGHVCGVMAARSLARGAWIAPANAPLRDVLATLPTLSMDDEWAFYQAGINPIRAGATGIVIWGSYTQSTEPELEDLNVRRLLILLRRLALVEGQTLAFAPNSPTLRRQVKQQFEQQLARLFKLGAFAGRDPSEAYQVVLDDTLNTAASIERGHLLVDLRVAPSRPLLFITVRLIQAEHEALRTQEVISHGR